MKTIVTTLYLVLLFSLNTTGSHAQTAEKPKAIKDHAGVKDIFMNIFAANLKNLPYLIQEPQFLAVISHLEMHILELKINDLQKWMKDQKQFIMVAMFEAKVQQDLKHELIFKSPLLPVFFKEELTKDIDGINHYLKKYKKPPIQIKKRDLSQSEKEEITKVYYYLLDTNEAKVFCDDLKSVFNEENTELWCTSKSNSVMSLLCYDIFCTKK